MRICASSPATMSAIALLTSGGKADGLYRDLFTEAAAALVGLRPRDLAQIRVWSRFRIGFWASTARAE